MRIANNVMAMNTHRFYTSNNATVSKSAEKLSSGYRVNRAGDDAAGLAISEKMRAQVRGMNMASKNSQDAVSLVQTAEGALQEVHSMLQRMNEMAVQSANGTNQNLDRQALNLEFTNLRAEIDQVATTTNFNERTLLDGTLRGSFTATAEAGNGNFTFDNANTNVTINSTIDATALAAAVGANSTGATEAGSPASVTIGVNSSNQVELILGGTVIGRSAALENFNDAGTDGESAVTMNITAVGGSATLGTISIVGTDGAHAATASELATSLNASTGGAQAFSIAADPNNPGLTLQVGATAGETLGVSIASMNSTGLGLASATIAEQGTETSPGVFTGARQAIQLTKDAINAVSTQRATLGALQNRLEHKIANLDNTSENLSAAESRIRDVDMAKEMTAFTKNNILSQAATAMLAQANSSPQNVLSLLR